MFIVASTWAEAIRVESSSSPGRKINATFAPLSSANFARDSIESKVTPHETATVSDDCLLAAGNPVDNPALSVKLLVPNDDVPSPDILAVSSCKKGEILEYFLGLIY